MNARLVGKTLFIFAFARRRWSPLPMLKCCMWVGVGTPSLSFSWPQGWPASWITCPIFLDFHCYSAFLSQNNNKLTRKRWRVSLLAIVSNLTCMKELFSGVLLIFLLGYWMGTFLCLHMGCILVISFFKHLTYIPFFTINICIFGSYLKKSKECHSLCRDADTLPIAYRSYRSREDELVSCRWKVRSYRKRSAIAKVRVARPSKPCIFFAIAKSAFVQQNYLFFTTLDL